MDKDTLRRSAGIAVFLCLFGGIVGCNWLPWNWGKDKAKQVETGYACWYGAEYQGRSTASGERFDQWAMTAAHRTLPFGSVVLVKNLQNNKAVKVRINDRGPWNKNRLIDLSRGAAKEIGMIEAGVAQVRIEVLKWGPQ